MNLKIISKVVEDSWRDQAEDQKRNIPWLFWPMKYNREQAMKTVVILIIMVFCVSCHNNQIDNIISTDEFSICLNHSIERRGDYYFVQYDDSIGVTFLYEIDKATNKLRIKDDFRSNIIKEYKYLYNLDDASVEKRLINKASELIDLINKYDLYQIDGWNKYFGIIEIYLNESDFLIYSKEGKKNIEYYLEKFPKYKTGCYLTNNYYKVN